MLWFSHEKLRHENNQATILGGVLFDRKFQPLATYFAPKRLRCNLTRQAKTSSDLLYFAGSTEPITDGQPVVWAVE